VAVLGFTYANAYATVRPYSHNKLPIDCDCGEPATVGQTVFFDVDIPARRPGAHITAVHATVTHGLMVRFLSTTFQRTGENNLSGFPLSCAGPASLSPVAGTPLNRSTYLRMELTATRPGRSALTSITVDWADGLLHGSASTDFWMALRATPHGEPVDCPSGQSTRQPAI
jgi:hypothetical protein